MDTSNVKITNNKKVVFSIISCEKKLDSKYKESYEKAVIQLTKYFVKKGYKICYMSFCQKEGDEEAINEIADKCGENVEKYFYRGNREEALNKLGDCQIIIGGRFHANILGLLLHKTIIPMMYSDKTKNVLEEMNFKGKILDIRKLDNFNVEDLTEEDITYKQDISYQISNANLQFKELDKKLK